MAAHAAWVWAVRNLEPWQAPTVAPQPHMETGTARSLFWGAQSNPMASMSCGTFDKLRRLHAVVTLLRQCRGLDPG